MNLRNVNDNLYAVNVILGTVTSTAEYMPDFVNILDGGYAIQTSENSEAGDPNLLNEKLPFIKLYAIEAVIERKLNIVLIVCDICISTVYDYVVLDQVELIIMEEDVNIDYQLWHKTLSEIFDCIWYTQ